MQTPHGSVETPAFMPVGTQGAVKGVTHRDLESSGAEILLSNTYHLYLRPGDDLIARRGGLHPLPIGWNKPMLTDSGGYQVFSLADWRTVDEQGAHFRSHLDGSPHLLTPEKAADIQAQLGSDVAMVLDECLAHPWMWPMRMLPDGAQSMAVASPRTAIAFWRSRDRAGARRGRRPIRVRRSSASSQGSVFPELRWKRKARGRRSRSALEAHTIGAASQYASRRR